MARKGHPKMTYSDEFLAAVEDHAAAGLSCGLINPDRVFAKQ
jgi:hypothetical protein